LDLRDFDHLDQKDLVPIISALEYNTWFTKLRISHLKLSHEPLDRLLHVLKRSLSIQEIYLDNIGAKWYVPVFYNNINNKVALQLRIIFQGFCT
jgi:hypothetical protein